MNSLPDIRLAYQLTPPFKTVESLSEHYLGLYPEGLRVDLGCGFYKPAGFIGVDNLIGSHSQIPDQGNLPDILMDLNRDRIPLPDQSCVEIRTSHFLEHSNLPHIFDEVFRMLKPGGVFINVFPYANSAEGMYPGHNIFLTEKWFEKNLHFQRLFFIDEIEYFESEDYSSLPAKVKELLPFPLARKFLFNACCQMRLICRTRRGHPEGKPLLTSESKPGITESAAEIASLRKQLEELRAEHNALKDRLDRVLASSSWRITKPLRALKRSISGHSN